MLTAVLDPTAIPDEVVVNERATVAAAYAMAQFTDGRQIGGTSPGLQNAAGTAQNLVDLRDGDVGVVLRRPPNGALRTFNSLANLLATVQSEDECRALFVAARPPRGPAPRDTFGAMVNIAHNPWKNVAELFALSQQSTVYQPALESDAQPDAWTLALRYQGDGPEGQRIDGPGNIAFDKDGNAWVNINFRYNADSAQSVCEGRKDIKLTPTGGSAPGAPYRGGGLYGAGYGITVDPHGHVWVGNFGFQGQGCPISNPELSKSVCEFSANGRALSPPNGVRNGDMINRPQGTVSDRKGTIWVANCGGQSVTRIVHDNPNKMRNTDGIGSKPFSVAPQSRLGNAQQ